MEILIKDNHEIGIPFKKLKQSIAVVTISEVTKVLRDCNLRVRMFWGSDVEIFVPFSISVNELMQMLIQSVPLQRARAQYPTLSWLFADTSHLRLSHIQKRESYLDSDVTLESLHIDFDICKMRLEPQLFLVSTKPLLSWDFDSIVSPAWLELRQYSQVMKQPG